MADEVAAEKIAGRRGATQTQRMDEAAAIAAEPWLPPPGSKASSLGNRRSMQSNRGRDTKPELAVRRLLHASGLRYRVSRRPLPQLKRTADIVFGPTRVAVFIDGCYWHGCPQHGQRPKTNADFWNAKIDGNVRRDRETDRLLTEAGWTVLRFWEHEAPSDCVTRITEVVTARRPVLSERRPSTHSASK